jgi:phosphate transport system permease protein
MSSAPLPTKGTIARRRWEAAIAWALRACGALSILTTVGIVLVLVGEAIQFFRVVSPIDFMFGTKWNALIDPRSFGVLPLVCGTLLVAFGALVVAVPVGLGTAIYLSEYAGPGVRDIVKPMLEILAGIPSVVYGYVAIVLISPAIRYFFPGADVFNAASAAIVVGVMVLPMIVSLSEDVLRSVPSSLREAAYALGANKFDVTVRVVIPAAFSGIMASFLLAFARAIGETMAVTLAAGYTPNLTLNPLREIQTMTAFIVQVRQGDAPAGTIEYKSLFAVAMGLFLITMIVNMVAQWILRRVREQYE